MPDDRHEELEQRLAQYARSFTDFHMPSLAAETADDESTPGKLLHSMALLEKDWSSLRERVLSDDAQRDEDEDLDPHPSHVTLDGIRHLQAMVDVLSRRIDELEQQRMQEIKLKHTWMESSDSEDSRQASDEESRKVIVSTEQRIETIEEKLSLAKYRMSMAETMLTQITLFDTVQPWEDFFQMDSRPTETQGGDPSDNIKRTILIGLALDHFQSTKGYLPSFGDKGEYGSKSNFKLVVSDLPPKDLILRYGPGTVEHALRETDCWMTGKPGRTGAHLRETMQNAIRFAENHQWRPGKDVLASLKKTAMKLFDS
jgi:hypothetical protein